MTLSGKADSFDLDDLRKFGRMADLKPRQTDGILREVEEAAEGWEEFVSEAGVPGDLAQGARAGFRFFLAGRSMAEPDVRSRRRDRSLSRARGQEGRRLQ